jgi:carbamoylphosphate synthase small subunit
MKLNSYKPSDCPERVRAQPRTCRRGAAQFHPELKSKPFDPHPLFASFIEAAVKQSRLV